MGTQFTITLYATNSTSAQIAAKAAFQRVADLENIMSDYQADSELMRLCDQTFGHPVAVSVDLFDILQKSQRIAELSGGAFDVTVGPFVRLWRFSRKRNRLPSTEEIATARAAVGWRKMKLDQHAHTVTLLVPEMRLDLGGMGKGYAADQALRVLRAYGITRAIVAASGDIAFGDPPPGERGWKTDIAGMDGGPSPLKTAILLHNAGISTSGDSEQFVEINGVRYSHILDPTTGLGMTNRVQATIIGPDATTTDSLDTTVALLGPVRGFALVDSFPHAAALILTKEGTNIVTHTSRRFARLAQHN
jgi:thiamine biosynthesis lipoprotein